MNAYDLAKFLEVDAWYKLVTREEIATMLRQQADRIAELEEELKMIEKNYDNLYDQLNKQVSSKPVAWMNQEKNAVVTKPYDLWGNSATEFTIPLYTHPVKQLSDGEIIKISENCDLNHVLGIIDFARAIIKEITE